MSTTVDVLDGMPCSFEAGTTLRFTDSDSEHPATLWTAVLVLNNGVDAATSISGTTYNTTGFQFVIPASTALAPGNYQWAQYFTAIDPVTEKERGKTGVVAVLPNLATTATPTTAQAMVTLLETALQLLAATTTTSVSFNGQSFSQSSMGEYQAQLVYWQSRVIAEQRKAGVMRGENVNGGAGARFARSEQIFPFSDCGCR